MQCVHPYIVHHIYCDRVTGEGHTNSGNVQRTATKMVASLSILRKLPYESRLDRHGLTTLERRRITGDFIEIYKIGLLTGKEKVDMEQFFELSNTGHNLRGHNYMKLAVNSYADWIPESISSATE